MSAADDDFTKALEEGLSQQEEALETPPVDPPKDDPVQEDGGKDDTEPKDPKKEEPPKKKDSQDWGVSYYMKPVVPGNKPEGTTLPTRKEFYSG